MITFHQVYKGADMSFVQQLLFFLALDILLGFIYALVPTELSILRQILGLAQLIAIAVTMWIAIRYVLKDF